MEQRWQNVELLLYRHAWSITSHEIMGVVPFFFNSPTHFDSSVEFARWKGITFSCRIIGMIFKSCTYETIGLIFKITETSSLMIRHNLETR